MRNISKLDRYYNWYHGYTEISQPTIYESAGLVDYRLYTTATSGTISTQYFGDNFDADKVETKVYYQVYVYPPESVRNNPNVTLHFDTEKLSMKELSSSTGKDRLRLNGYTGNMKENSTHASVNFTPPDSSGSYWSTSNFITLDRNVILADVLKQKLDLMPGFRFNWYYSGIEVEPDAKYFNDNQAFIRNGSISIKLSFLSILPSSCNPDTYRYL